MGHYRYRTSVLVGPWRDTFERAVADAVRSGQARLGEGSAEPVWVVPGTIETSGNDEETERL